MAVRSRPFLIVAWLAMVLAAGCLVPGAAASATSRSLATLAPIAEGAEEAGVGEESTVSEGFRVRQKRRRARRQAPKRSSRPTAARRFSRWAPPLVVPTTIVPRRGPPLHRS